jgi:hypothetical protein
MDLKFTSLSVFVFVSCAALTGCDQSSANAAPVAKAAPKAKALVAGSGTGTSLSALVDDQAAINGASVMEINPIPRQPASAPARMFGMSVGDPAMNGLYTYLAFDTDEGPAVFLIGNINRYSILAASPGRVDLEINENGQRADGTITNVIRRAIVTWTIPAGASAPTRVTVTPAG